MKKIIKLQFIYGGRRDYSVGDDFIIKTRETIEKIEFVGANTAVYLPAEYDFGTYYVFTNLGHIISLPARNYSAIWEEDGETCF